MPFSDFSPKYSLSRETISGFLSTVDRPHPCLSDKLTYSTYHTEISVLLLTSLLSVSPLT
jgi:hypothetical protein